MIKKISQLIFLSYVISAMWLVAYAQENVTITTYYPSPVGSYRELRANRVAVDPNRAMPVNDGWLAWGNGRGALVNDQGGSLELGGSGTPYIDFYNDMNMATDYEMRIILNNDNELEITGGETHFTNDDGTPATISVNEVLFCVP